MIGEGFSITEPCIERKYDSCKDDGQAGRQGRPVLEVRQRHKHRVPDWSDKGTTATTDDDPVTNSVWTVPDFGDDSGAPCCKSTGFADSSCNQAWR
ncbi:hypothetical protein [Streptomyces sp. NPDC005148]